MGREISAVSAPPRCFPVLPLRSDTFWGVGGVAHTTDAIALHIAKIHVETSAMRASPRFLARLAT